MLDRVEVGDPPGQRVFGRLADLYLLTQQVVGPVQFADTYLDQLLQVLPVPVQILLGAQRFPSQSDAHDRQDDDEAELGDIKGPGDAIVVEGVEEAGDSQGGDRYGQVLR